MPRNPIRNLALAAGAFVMAGPAVAQQYTMPVEVETAEFGANTFDIGSLTPSTGALPSDLWRGTEAADISFLLDNLPTPLERPAELDLLRRALLSPGEGPQGADSALTAKKLLTLAEAGFYEEAAALAELPGRLASQPDLSQAVAYADLLRGDLSLACRRGANLQQGRGEPFWLKLRLICYTNNDEQAAADLTLGLLREQGSLQGREERLFTALVTGATPDSFASPVTGFDYVAARQLGAQFGAEDLENVSGVILRAIANDPEADMETRAYALYEALYLGIIQPADGRSLIEGFEFDPEMVANAREAMEERPDDPLTPLLLYRAAAQMTAPEFTIDRTELIGQALMSTGDAPRFIVLSQLFAPLAGKVEVITNYTPFAVEFALAGITAERTGLAEKWIAALSADQVNEDSARYAMMLVSLMSLKDPGEAEAIADRYGLVIQPMDRQYDLEKTAEPAILPQLVGIGLRTARTGAEGQAALSWLIAAHTGAEGEMATIRDMLKSDARSVMASVDIEGELAYETALQGALDGLQPRRDAAAEMTGPDGQFLPRVKPGNDTSASPATDG